MRRREEDSVLEERKKKQREAVVSQGRQEEEKKVEGMNLFKMTSFMNKDSTLKMPIFHGNGKEDPKQHRFVCEAIWSVKLKVDDYLKIAMLETMFKDHALAWYMKFKSTAPIGVGRTLVENQQELFKEFQKPMWKCQCIAEIKETKQKQGDDHDRVESSSRISRLQSQLATLTLKLQELAKGK